MERWRASRRPHQRGSGSSARAPVRGLPSAERGKPGGRAHVDRRTGPDRKRLQGARLLGHRDLHAALLHLDLSGGGEGAAHVPLPHASCGAEEGRPVRVPRSTLRVGVGRHGRGRHAVAGCPAGRRSHSHPHGGAGAAHQRRCRLRRLELLARDRRRAVPSRCGRRNPPGDRPLLGEPRGTRSGRPVPHPRRHRARRVPRDRGRRRLHQRHGEVEPADGRARGQDSWRSDGRSVGERCRPGSASVRTSLPNGWPSPATCTPGSTRRQG